MDKLKWNYNYSIGNIKKLKDGFIEKQTEDEILDIAEAWLHGKVSFGYKDLQVVDFDDSDFMNWNNLNIDKNANTVRLYFYGLRGVYYLANAYEHTKEKKYIEKAITIVESFYTFFSVYHRIGKLNNMVKNDHAMAERIENLIYMYAVIKSNGYPLTDDAIIRIIEHDVDCLMGEEYYQKNHNHGIIADKACLLGIYFLNKPNYLKDMDFVIRRLNAQIEYAYSKEGVHKENSIDYHIAMLDLLYACVDILRASRLTDLEDQILNILNKAQEFLLYAIKPNGRRPLYGDSKGTADNDKAFCSINDYGNEFLKYIISYGKEGRKPPKLLKWFGDGYVFFREHFESEKFKDATWCSLKCGYSTRIHKHADDMSICLYSKGQDIFVDSGMQGYMPKDFYKDYMESPAAHSTIAVENATYSIASGNGSKVKILQVFNQEWYDYALAFSAVYKNVLLYRQIFFIRSMNTILIVDDVFSNQDEQFCQYFNLGQHVELIELSKQKAVLSLSQSNCFVELTQYENVDKVECLAGNSTNPGSFLSTGFASSVPAETLKYTKKCIKGGQQRFVTSVEIDKAVSQSSIEMNNNTIIISDEKQVKQIEIPTITPLSIPILDIKCKEESVYIVNHNNKEISIYIFDLNSGKVIKMPYTTESEFPIDLKDLKECVLLVHYKGIQKEMMKGLLGKISIEEGKYNIVRYEKIHVPEIVDEMCCLEDNIIKASVDIKYEFGSTCSWWVYYNGGLEHFEKGEKTELEFSCNKAGEYVVMCSLRDRFFGEYYFKQFELIVYK